MSRDTRRLQLRSAPHLGWWIALAGGIAVSSAGTASACGPGFLLASFGFAPQQPDASAQMLPRNASIVLHLTCSPSATDAPDEQAVACRFSPLGAKVSLRPAAGGDEVPGRLVVNPDSLIFLPAAPLSANTDYTLTAVLGAQGTTNPGATFSTSLRTSDNMLAPFVSALPPSVVSEWYDAPVTQCDDAKLVGQAALDVLDPSTCPNFHTHCQPAGTERTLRLHVEFGPLSGGFTALDYTAQLKLSSGGLSGFQGDEGAAPASPPENTMPPPTGIVLDGAYATTGPSGSTDLFVDLTAPADSEELLCVRARAFDAAGQVLYAPEPCKTYVGWMTDAEWSDEAAGTAQAAAAPGTLPARTTSIDAGMATSSPGDEGCSVRPASQRMGGHTLTWLSLSLAVLQARRRRRNT